MIEFSELKSPEKKVEKSLTYLDTKLGENWHTLKEYRIYYESFCPDFYKIIEIFKEVSKTHKFEEQESEVKRIFAKNYFIEET